LLFHSPSEAWLTYSSIDADSENLAAINALAGMGILTDDDGLVEAAVGDLLALPLDRRLELDPQRHINYLLTKHHIGQVSVYTFSFVSEPIVRIRKMPKRRWPWRREQYLQNRVAGMFAISLQP
jgi:hypothetical protein